MIDTSNCSTTLSMNDVDRYDTGTYIVLAENNQGSATHAFQVTVRFTYIYITKHSPYFANNS